MCCNALCYASGDGSTRSGFVGAKSSIRTGKCLAASAINNAIEDSGVLCLGNISHECGQFFLFVLVVLEYVSQEEYSQ